ITITDPGWEKIEQLLGIGNIADPENWDLKHHVETGVKAHALYHRDVEYVIQEDEIIIVDEFTGRLMPGRRWSDGLHQAVEAKEGVKVKEENQTYATITLQNFFKLYDKISGMTGTAMTEAAEFWKIYKLDVIAIPTNRAMQRMNYPDVIYRTEREKFEAIVEEIERLHKWDFVELADGKRMLGTITKEQEERQWIERSKIKELEQHGRPVLVGTVSIEKSERLSAMLNRKGVKHEVLNA